MACGPLSYRERKEESKVHLIWVDDVLPASIVSFKNITNKSRWLHTYTQSKLTVMTFLLEATKVQMQG